MFLMNKAGIVIRRTLPFRIVCFMRLIKALLLVFLAWINRKKKPLVLVYQSGKVGSVSVYQAIKKSRQFSVLHIHRINKQHIEQRRRIAKKKKWRIEAGDELGLVLYRAIKFFPRIKIICPIREPLSRNVSAFFQNITRMPLGISQLDNQGKANYFIKEFDHQTADKWFDEELKIITGIDVFKYPFNLDKGYLQINKAQFDVLILYHDLPDYTKSEIISNFLGKKISVEHIHSSNQKEYSDSYSEVKKIVMQNNEYVSRMQACRYYKHFYLN